MILQLRDLVKSHDELKALYFNLQKTYGHKTRQGGDLSEIFLPLKSHNYLTT